MYACCVHCDHEGQDLAHDDPCDVPGCPGTLPPAGDAT
jgi:hypothetical protein